MKRQLQAIGVALLLASLLAPVTLAAGGAAPVADPAPVAEPTVAPDPSPTPVENGEIVIDPTFITASPTPAGNVQGATGRPDVTPPATDAAPATLPAATAPGTGLQVLLVLGVAGSLLALLAGRRPAARRR